MTTETDLAKRFKDFYGREKREPLPEGWTFAAMFSSAARNIYTLEPEPSLPDALVYAASHDVAVPVATFDGTNEELSDTFKRLVDAQDAAEKSPDEAVKP